MENKYRSVLRNRLSVGPDSTQSDGNLSVGVDSNDQSATSSYPVTQPDAVFDQNLALHNPTVTTGEKVTSFVRGVGDTVYFTNFMADTVAKHVLNGDDFQSYADYIKRAEEHAPNEKTAGIIAGAVPLALSMFTGGGEAALGASALSAADSTSVVGNIGRMVGSLEKTLEKPGQITYDMFSKGMDFAKGALVRAGILGEEASQSRVVTAMLHAPQSVFARHLIEGGTTAALYDFSNRITDRNLDGLSMEGVKSDFTNSLLTGAAFGPASAVVSHFVGKLGFTSKVGEDTASSIADHNVKIGEALDAAPLSRNTLEQNLNVVKHSFDYSRELPNAENLKEKVARNLYTSVKNTTESRFSQARVEGATPDAQLQNSIENEKEVTNAIKLLHAVEVGDRTASEKAVNEAFSLVHNFYNSGVGEKIRTGAFSISEARQQESFQTNISDYMRQITGSDKWTPANVLAKDGGPRSDLLSDLANQYNTLIDHNNVLEEQLLARTENLKSGVAKRAIENPAEATKTYEQDVILPLQNVIKSIESPAVAKKQLLVKSGLKKIAQGTIQDHLAQNKISSTPEIRTHMDNLLTVAKTYAGHLNEDGEVVRNSGSYKRKFTGKSYLDLFNDADEYRKQLDSVWYNIPDYMRDNGALKKIYSDLKNPVTQFVANPKIFGDLGSFTDQVRIVRNDFTDSLRNFFKMIKKNKNGIELKSFSANSELLLKKLEDGKISDSTVRKIKTIGGNMGALTSQDIKAAFFAVKQPGSKAGILTALQNKSNFLRQVSDDINHKALATGINSDVLVSGNRINQNIDYISKINQANSSNFNGMFREAMKPISGMMIKDQYGNFGQPSPSTEVMRGLVDLKNGYGLGVMKAAMHLTASAALKVIPKVTKYAKASFGGLKPGAYLSPSDIDKYLLGTRKNIDKSIEQNRKSFSKNFNKNEKQK